MKLRNILIAIAALLFLFLCGWYYVKFGIASHSPDNNGAYVAKKHISEEAAIAALNANNIQLQDGNHGDTRIYLKDKQEWFIIDGDYKKFNKAMETCGARCMMIPLVVP